MFLTEYFLRRNLKARYTFMRYDRVMELPSAVKPAVVLGTIVYSISYLPRFKFTFYLDSSNNSGGIVDWKDKSI